MKYKFYRCTDQFITDQTPQIISVAQKAFTSFPANEIEKRIDQYDEVLLILDKSRIIGFSFVSFHERAKTFYVGARLVVVDPLYKGQGLLRVASIYLSFRYLWIFTKRVLSFKSSRLCIFSRQCNPIAYRLIYMGQEIFPDLPKGTQKNVPEWVKADFEFLADQLGIDNLDANTGVIKNGAAHSGITRKDQVAGVDKGWKIPWDQYVPEGSELISLIPLGLSYPLTACWYLSKRFFTIAINLIKRVVTNLRGLVATLRAIADTCVLSVIYLIGSKNHVSIDQWARRILKYYQVSYSILGNLPADLKHSSIIVANHTSLLDTFLYPAILPTSTVYIAKSELRNIPFIPRKLKEKFCFFIDRSASVKSLRRILKFVETLDKDSPLFLHPEGTRSVNDTAEFKRGYLLLAKKSSRKIIQLQSEGGEQLWAKGKLFPFKGHVSIRIIEGKKR